MMPAAGLAMAAAASFTLSSGRAIAVEPSDLCITLGAT
jgi:hypothetical protein